MKNLKSTFVLSLLIVAYSCQYPGNKNERTTDSMAMEPPQSEEAPAPPLPPQDPIAKPQPVQNPSEPIARQIIKTANYRFQVKNVEESAARIAGLVGKFGGYVSGTALTNSNYEITEEITIRVPAAKFDELLAALGSEAVFTQYKRVNSEDVTEEYVDVLTRLKTKKEVRDRYIDILKTKARTVEDILRAEEQIRVIQEEIESKEGRLRFLKDQVGMSTIHLEIYQSIEYRPEPDIYKKSFGSKLLGALEAGWDLLQDLAIFFISIWPLLIIGGLVFWKRKWLGQKIRRRKVTP